MAGNVSKTRSLAVTAQKTANATGTYIVITNNGGPDTADVSAFNVTVDALPQDVTSLNKTVGTSQTFTGTSGQKNRVLVTATFTDGTQQVILDTQV